MGLRVILDTVVKKKIPNPHQESNPRTLDSRKLKNIKVGGH
jgi:hypothetical protein